MNFFKPSIGKEFNIITGLTVLYGVKHKIETGLGLVHDFLPQYVFVNDKDYIKYKAIIYSVIGYMYQPKTKGLIVKASITPTLTINPDNLFFYPFVEIGLGYKF